MADNPSPGPSKTERRIINAITAIAMISLVLFVLFLAVLFCVQLWRLVF